MTDDSEICFLAFNGQSDFKANLYSKGLKKRIIVMLRMMICFHRSRVKSSTVNSSTVKSSTVNSSTVNSSTVNSSTVNSSTVNMSTSQIVYN